jgi:arsenite methyltransferase
VDVVTTRSVLIYVKDKPGAMREFYRVLKPGGRVSLFEPINVLMSAGHPDRLYGYDTGPVSDIAAKVQAVFESIQPRAEDPMVDFDERDLVRQAEAAGFPTVSLELRVTVQAEVRPVPWPRFLRMSGNPLIPSLAEVMDQVLSPQEIAEFTGYLRPLVESGTGQERRALAYLTAVKDPG